MEKQMIWKQTERQITQMHLSDVVHEVSGETGWTQDRIEDQLVDKKARLLTPGARYHIWRDSL